MSEGSSYRQILRSSSIIGGASVVNILVGLLRVKVAAVLLGPAGIGLIGLFTNIVATASTIAGLGVGIAGTRQIAEAVGQENQERITTARRALFWGTMVLAIGGAFLCWSFREFLASWVLRDAKLATEIGWLSIAVALTVAAASQNALLTGLRRTGDIARVSVGTAILSTIAGIATLWWFGRAGVVPFVICAPLAGFLLGHWYVARLPRLESTPTAFRTLLGQWRVLSGLGLAFMVAGLAGTAGQLVVRTMVQRELGVEALGQFQAAWAISMTYIGFVLTAMGADYYPRLTASIHDHDTANRLVNEQTEVALLIATPVLLAMLMLAPWVIRVLYTDDFAEAGSILRWQVLGDFLKIASWPLGFILLAAGAGRTFMLAEWVGMTSFVLLTWLILPYMAVVATGVAFLGLYGVYLPMMYWLAARRTGFHYVPRVAWLLLTGLATATVVIVFAQWVPWASVILGTVSALALSGYATVRLAATTGTKGVVGKVAGKISGLVLRISK